MTFARRALSPQTPSHGPRRGLPLLLPLFLALQVAATAAAPLSLDEAVALALRDAPSLAALRERIDAARQAERPAGERPDPRLRFGLENLPIGGPDRFTLNREPMTMQRIAWMQDLPNRDKRDARVAVAEARTLRAQAEQRALAAMVRRETALAWIRRHSVEQQLERLQALFDENRLLDTAVRAQLAGGKGMPADALMPQQEAAMLAERRDELLMQREQARAALRRWVGAAADEALAGPVPAWPLDAHTLHERLDHHPEFAALDAMGGMLDAELREARSMKQADWGVEVAYQRRGRAFGDMLSVMLSVDLPLAQERRQDPLVAAKAAERRALDAERESMLREHAQMLASDLAERERLERALQRVQTQLLPLAQERIALLMAGYRAGRNSLQEVVVARREQAELQLRAVALRGEHEAMAARLHFAQDLSGQPPPDAAAHAAHPPSPGAQPGTSQTEPAGARP